MATSTTVDNPVEAKISPLVLGWATAMNLSVGKWKIDGASDKKSKWYDVIQRKGWKQNVLIFVLNDREISVERVDKHSSFKLVALSTKTDRDFLLALEIVLAKADELNAETVASDKRSCSVQ